MALLTDVLVASPSEAEAICRASRHFENWACWEAKGCDNLVLSDLVRALGAEADAERLAGDDRLVYGEKDGPWVFHLPDVIPEKLSRLEDDEIPDLAERWLQGENAGYDLFQRWLPGEKPAGFEDAVVEGVVLALKDLRNLSKQALAANKSLLLWICL
jgi:hypothetical protein